MLKKLGIAALTLVLLGPSLGLIGVGLVMNPAASATCTVTGTNVRVGDVPDSLTVTTANGETFTLNSTQLTHAATIIETGSSIDGVSREALVIALMAALTESTLRMLANTSAYPESANYPNDGDGSDHDSLGLFQMRPQSGWGTVADLMDPVYQARAFFGGPDGPNYPSPRGLLDIPGWEQMDKGEAAQAVEISAYPDRYRNYEPVAEIILTTLTTTTGASPAAGDAAVPEVQTVAAESSRVVFPVPEGTWVLTSDYGPRVHPISGESSFHSGTDFAASDGTPILAAADGTVTVAEFSGDSGGLIVIEHEIAGQSVATAYRHMWETGIHVAAGDRVSAGQHIGDIGSSGNSTGPHLHFEVRQGGTGGEHIEPAAWLNSHNAADLPEPATGAPAGCEPETEAPGGEPAPVDGDLAGLFDGPSTVRFDPSLPMISLDLSRVTENSTLISVLMTCSSAWMESALLDPGGGQRWVIYDEAWRLMSHPALLKRMDAHWRLARHYGIANMLIFHKLSDLDNVGDAGSAMRSLANSLLANAETRIVYRQESDQLGPTAQALGLTGTEQKLLPSLGVGQGLWRIKDRAFVTQHQLHPAELELFDTSSRLTSGVK